MKILFITATRIGDAILSLGLIDHIARTYPQAHLTIVSGALPAPLFESVPGLENLIILKKRPWNGHWMDLWRQTRRTKWDMVVDLRNSIVSRLIPARRRFIHGRQIDRTRHKVEQNAQVMRLSPPPAPRLFLSEDLRARAQALIPPGGPVLGIGPTSNWAAKTWPPGCFIDLVYDLIRPDGPLPFARVAVFAAPDEDHLARPVCEALPPELCIDLIGKTDVALAGACLERCALYIGNDSGLMHMAAAAGTPTVGLFGPGWPEIYRPWGPKAAYVSTPETRAQLTSYPGFDPETAPCLMTSLSVEAVAGECARLLESLGFSAPTQRSGTGG
ncbi:MAG: glycosyltransferase family 9 protein [Rhodospirillales bacterium]|nr:glycosyltransferase family 9 protein [Rhodospirillales bacterium]